MLADAVVIAGDCARADVDVVADYSIPKIGMMAGFGALPEHSLFQLDEITDVDRFAQLCIWAKVRERPNRHPGIETAAVDDTEVLHGDAIGEHRVDDANARVYLARLADLRPSLEVHTGMDHRISADHHILVDIRCCRIFDRDAGGH